MLKIRLSVIKIFPEGRLEGWMVALVDSIIYLRKKTRPININPIRTWERKEVFQLASWRQYANNNKTWQKYYKTGREREKERSHIHPSWQSLCQAGDQVTQVCFLHFSVQLSLGFVSTSLLQLLIVLRSSPELFSSEYVIISCCCCFVGKTSIGSSCSAILLT